MARLRARRTLTLSSGALVVLKRRFSLTFVDVSVKTIFGTAPLRRSAMSTVVSPG
jgi:hypothetical protein